MKYIKQYESIDNPKIGDYVILNSDALKGYFVTEETSDQLKEFLDNNIGQVVWSHQFYPVDSIKVAFDVQPPLNIRNAFMHDLDIEKYCISVSANSETIKRLINQKPNIKYITEFAPTIEELQAKMRSNKYNL